MNTLLADKNKCSGCSACMNICPVNAITMITDSEGFLYPKISEEKCIHCNKCSNTCPALVLPSSHNLNKSKCYAMWANDDIRSISSSGGIFTLLAEEILALNGIIYGAYFDENWNIKHGRFDSYSALYKLRGSKYAQSVIGNIYKQVKQDLQDSKYVLFSGTPCQIAGLYNYLGKDSDYLLTVDLLCHGVPSQKVLHKYLNDSFPNKNIKNISFRNKEHFGWSSSMHITFSDDTSYQASCQEDPFYKAFLPCLSLRPSCENCLWSSNARSADISIGDYWGIDKISRSYDDRKGTSCVLVNSPKGEHFFNKARNSMTFIQELPINTLTPGNPTLLRPFNAHTGRKHFFSCLDILPFHKLVEHSLNHHYDVGIAGLWYGLNYGSILTYYALYKVVNQLGYDAIFLSKPNSLWTEKYNSSDSIAAKFIYPRCNVTNRKNSFSEWYGLNNNCDTFMVGSDVIWNYNICGKESGEFFFLDFVSNSKKKIAYASSFGSGYSAPENIRKRASYYLKRFDAVAVRETEAQEICKNTFGVSADRVLDAVFLCNPNVFHEIADSSSAKETNDFIASYILGPDTFKKNAILKTSNYLNLPYRIFVDPNEPKRSEERLELNALKLVAVEDWLYYIKNCKCFIADSYHGVCFAIIFRVPFMCYIRRDEPSKCRFINLLKLCGLENRLVYTDEELDECKLKIVTSKIDYDSVYEKLNPEINFSYQWLKTALQKSKSDDYTFENRFEEFYVKFLNETEELRKENQQLRKRLHCNTFPSNPIEKVVHYYKQYGPKKTFQKIYSKLFNI